MNPTFCVIENRNVRRTVRRLFLGIAQAVTLSGLAMAKTWGIATSTNSSTGRAIIFRYLNEFDSGFSRRSQPVRAIIVWKYKGTN